MRFAIFEGPESGPRDILITHREQLPGDKVKETHATYTERPFLLGWRHYMLIQVRDGGVETRSTTAKPEAMQRVAAGLRARFYHHGTWEQGPYLNGAFPCPRPEILEECGITPKPAQQTELAV